MSTIARTLIPVRERLDGVLPEVEQLILEPIIADIDRLKQQRNAVVLAHNYMTPDIYHGVADLQGDSLQLARMAAETEAEILAFLMRALELDAG